MSMFLFSVPGFLLGFLLNYFQLIHPTICIVGEFELATKVIRLDVLDLDTHCLEWGNLMFCEPTSEGVKKFIVEEQEVKLCGNYF